MVVQIGPRPTLSPTALSAYEICGRRGQYYQDPNIPKGPPTAAMARGSAYHKALEFYNTLRLNGEPLPDKHEMLEVMGHTLQGIVDQPDFEWADGAEKVDTVDALARMVTRWWTPSEPHIRWDQPGIEVVAVETQLFVSEFGRIHDFNGYADVIYDVPTLGHVGVDHKSTGKAWGGMKAAGDPRKLVQAPLYAEAYERRTGIPMDWFVFDVMTVAGKFQRVWVPTNLVARAPFITRWEEISESINLHRLAGLDMPTNPGHILCTEKWCQFWTICPMGESLSAHLTASYPGGTP